jgi:hypothetical protein
MWFRLGHLRTSGRSLDSNPERKAFFEPAWHLGAAQGDLATLGADNIDWENKFISFRRKKTGTVAVLRFGDAK